ncbi:serine carboxypeptidase [Pleurotus eryngii]|uniref:Carboxypeptidase n=1 Tax=Pleurotus eryngii TaxID=5323 RepID=A0A9P5ZS96_PLEER|nr:serine carboxypeptidase [Pleurotus eryngii]
MIIAHFVFLCFGVLVGAQYTAPIRPPIGFRVQEPIFRGSGGHYDSELFNPVEALDALSDKEFSVLGHPAFPNYGVRIRRTRWCDDTVRAYTGYIDIQAHHLFFYFFESRSDPDTDDVLLWTNGGPGGSSAVGLLMELGPCRVLDGDGPKFHPESWNSKANIFFIDQPVGTGFSYAEYGETAETTKDAAKDVAAFVVIFFEHFSKFRGRAFHLSGESYAGRYLPVFASEIYDQNARLVQRGITPINLNSIMIGNGATDMYSLILSWPDFACSKIGRPVLDIASCVAAKKMVPRCRKWMHVSCFEHFDALDCDSAVTTCVAALGGPYVAAGWNIYDITQKCEDLEAMCYPFLTHIQQFLNASTTRELLGADPAVARFALISPDVNAAFFNNLDHLHTSVAHVAALLERGVRVLIYSGSYDWVANWVGNERWVLDMAWSGQEEFNAQAPREWMVDGKVAGKTRSARGLTLATVEAAGHMAPYNKPKETLAMLLRWLSAEAL